MSIEIFYAAGGNGRYYLSPARCAADHPGVLVRTCSPRRAARLGLTWDPDDRAAHLALRAERKSERLRRYRSDPATGQRRKVED